MENIYLREKINKLFRKLRKHIYCRKNYMCCSSCGHNNIVNEAYYCENGYIFYHSQEKDSLREGATECYMQHCINEEYKPFAIKILKEFGCEWNGDDNETIIVRL
jgi:hypothetical protein